jgi:putative membrane protein
MTRAFEWPLDPSVYIGLAALLAGHAWLAHREGAPRRRQVYFGIGVLLIWAALETPLDTLGDEYLQSAHMVQHMVLMACAPPFLLLGLTPAMARTVLGAVPRPLRYLIQPIPAQILYAATMIGWHVPPIYDLALENDTVHIVEHLSFLVVGVLFWWSLIEATSSQADRPLNPVQKLLHLFVGTLPMMAVALPLQFTPVLLYTPYASAPRVNAFLTPGVDQTVAGALMMFIDMTAMTAAGLVVFFRWFTRAQRADATRADAYADLDPGDREVLQHVLDRMGRG